MRALPLRLSQAQHLTPHQAPSCLQLCYIIHAHRLLCPAQFIAQTDSTHVTKVDAGTYAQTHRHSAACVPPVQVHPEKVAALPMQQLQTLLQTLEFGLNATQPEAVQSALEALAALAKFDWQKKSSGQPGLAASPGEHYIEAQNCIQVSHKGQGLAQNNQTHMH